MTAYVLRRLAVMIPMLFAVSVISFVIIQLPPGSFLESMILELQAAGGDATSIAQIEQLEKRYGLDQPAWRQYLGWVTGIITRGDFGESFLYEKPVNQLIWSFVGYTVLIAGTSLAFVYLLALPLGCVAALKRYRWPDHAIGAVSFVGMSIPEFLLALFLLVAGLVWFDVLLLGLFSPEFVFQPWSWGKLGDLLIHLPIPAAVVAVNGTAGLLRIMRGSMIDALEAPYVLTAKAKGLPDRTVVGKHALRTAINPMISILGMSLPTLLSGSAIISIVLNLPTAGYLLFESLRVQDMYLAGTLILMLSALLLIGNLLADILLAVADPRIRYG